MWPQIENGFKKADINNIPTLTSQTIFSFLLRQNRRTGENAAEDESDKAGASAEENFRIDYVQVKRSDYCMLKAIVFSPDAGSKDEHHKVGLTIDESKAEIVSAFCDDCDMKNEICIHANAFLFWLHRKSTDTDSQGVHQFWGSENIQNNDEKSSALRIKDIFACDEHRMEAEMEAEHITDEDGQEFLNAVLEEMEKVGLADSALYRHCRSVVDEFETVYIHHTMLDNANNYVKDLKSFNMHMEDVAKQGLFDKLAEVSLYNYKKPMWLETQYCRIRCSQIHRVACRKDAKEDESILASIFCSEREWNLEERRQLKEHKRFILKQTEKLENKTYRECGLLLNEGYPYICASPDGITDDHIVEIKAPKTDEEFEKYLEGKETISSKYMAQIQIQMYMANVTKALYCVLSPTFDSNGALHYVWVQADMEFVANLLSAAEDFWRDVVFPRITSIYLDGN